MTSPVAAAQAAWSATEGLTQLAPRTALYGPSTVPAILKPAAGQPEWWRDRLYKKITERRPYIQFMDDYYSGNHPLPWLPSQAREEFRRILAMTRSNYMGLVCDAQVERMIVQGFRIGDTAEADKETWRIFQANNMDSDLDQGFLEATKSGAAYLMVGPNPKDSSTPRISVEHPLQTIVECQPGDRRTRAAGLKTWVDDWTGEVVARLYLPETVHGWRGKISSTSNVPNWRPDGEYVRNPVGEVPITELLNNPQLLGGGRSELYDLTDIQDRVNKTIADRLITQDFGAFPQKWAKGYPDLKADGTPNTIDIGRNRMVTSDVKETEFGQWSAAPLDPYSGAKREDVKDIASRSRTPAQYLLGEMSNVNGETLKASESGLVSKVWQRFRGHEDGIEDAVRMARRLAGIASSADASMETIWRNPQYRSDGEVTDAAIKRYQAGIATLRQVREDCGYSAAEIDRMEAEDAQGVQAPQNDGALADAQALSVRAVALGSMVRAGVEPEIAAQVAGIDGLRFIDGKPVTLKYDGP